MDELIVRTVGLFETIPDQIKNLFDRVGNIERDISHHMGEQDANKKLTIYRIKQIENDYQELRTKFEECQKQNCYPPEIKEKLDKLENNIGNLLRDYENRQETKKTVSGYIKEAITSIIRYAMLPVVIVLLLLFGFEERLIPWIKPDSHSAQQPSFDTTSMELLKLSHLNTINESDVIHFMNKYKDMVVVVYEENILEAKKQHNEIVNQRNLNSVSHIFIWFSNNNKTGYVQLYGQGMRAIGNEISINRGL
jgi:hypothetical protein